jgi:hypothetical protein
MSADLSGDEKMTQTRQAKILRDAKDKLNLTREELATILGVKPITLQSWLLPKGSKGHRVMNRTAMMLLEFRLKQDPEDIAELLKRIRRK